MRTRVIGAALLGAAILSLGSGCGSNNDGGTAAGPAPGAATTAPAGTQTTAAKSTGLACPSRATVGDQLDMTFPNDPDVNHSTDVISCSYQGKKKVTNASEFVMVTIYDNLDTSYMDRFRQQDAEWKPVNQSGAGDEAFAFQTQSFNKTLNNLVTRKGKRVPGGRRGRDDGAAGQPGQPRAGSVAKLDVGSYHRGRAPADGARSERWMSMCQILSRSPTCWSNCGSSAGCRRRTSPPTPT